MLLSTGCAGAGGQPHCQAPQCTLSHPRSLPCPLKERPQRLSLPCAARPRPHVWQLAGGAHAELARDAAAAAGGGCAGAARQPVICTAACFDPRRAMFANGPAELLSISAQTVRPSKLCTSAELRCLFGVHLTLVLPWRPLRMSLLCFRLAYAALTARANQKRPTSVAHAPALCVMCMLSMPLSCCS